MQEGKIKMAVIVAPRPLREKLGDEAVDSLIELLNKSEEKIKADVIALSGEKYEKRLSEEIGNIRIDMASLRAELKEDMAKLRAELKEDMAGLRAELREDMAGLRAELKESEERYERRLSEETGKLRVEMAKNFASIIKWMFIFWLGQIGAILGILFAFFKS